MRNLRVHGSGLGHDLSDSPSARGAVGRPWARTALAIVAAGRRGTGADGQAQAGQEDSTS